MLTPSVYLGADVSKPTIDLGCPHFAVPASIANTPAGFKALGKILARSPSPIHVVCEATGPYHQGFVAAHVVVSVVNPILKAVYQRLRAAGKAHKVALVAVMRKLLIHLKSLPFSPA